MLLFVSFAAAHVPFDRGDTTITELHAGPADAGGQWFEVRNNTGTTQNLVEQVFTDADGDTFEVALGVLVRAGETAVFAAGESTVDADYTFPDDFDLRAESGGITHTDTTGVIDAVVWDATWALSDTAAHQLDLGVVANEWANDLPGNWCAGAGTPRAENERCPGTDTDDDGDGYTEVDGDCDDTDADVSPGAYDGPDVADDGDCDGERDEDLVGDTGGDTGDTEDTGDTAPDTGDSGDSGHSGDTATDSGEIADTSMSEDTTPDAPPPAEECGCAGAAAGIAGPLWVVALARRRVNSRDDRGLADGAGARRR